MARTTQQIFDSMVSQGVALATAQGNTDMVAMFANTSNVAVWRLLFYVMAFAIMTFEQLMDAFTATVNTTITNTLPHTLPWYQSVAKTFQYGFTPIDGTATFDNSTATAQQIADSLIVQYSAVTETTLDGNRVLLLKVATLSSGILAPLSDTQFNAFTDWFNTIKDAGVNIVYYNQIADLIQVIVNVYYNPILIDGTGLRTDGSGDYPVKDAANNYLLNLGFNGKFINADFINALQAAYGVSNGEVDLVSIQCKAAGGDYQSVASSFIPASGYCAFDTTNGLTINYIADV